MNILTVKLKNGEFFQYDDFRDFTIEENKVLTVICENGSCNYFNWDCVSYVVQQDPSTVIDVLSK
jgi:hypothetical protein